MSLAIFKNKNKKSSESKSPKDSATSYSKSQINIRTVSKARSWVAELPMTDMGETTRRIFAAITVLNQDTLPPQVRIDVTEVLLPYVKMILENLDRHFLSRSFPLPERSQKIFDLKRSLIMELAGSYQLASLDMLTKKSISRKKLIISIGRAIQYMSMVILNDYSIYAKNEKTIWHDIHHLYLLACENDIENKDIPRKDDVNGEIFSIEEQYKLINIIALSAPNTLRESEVMRVREFFIQTLGEVVVMSDASNVQSKYAHIALMNSDEPATLMPISDLLDSPTSRIFDLSAVIHHLDQFVSLSESSDLGKHSKWPMLTHSLAKRLVYVLTTIRNRRYKRFPRDDKALLAIRMPDVITMIRDNDTESFLDQVNDDVEDDNIYEALAAEESVSSPWTEIDVESLAEDRAINIYSWKIENSSSGGYGLCQIKNEKSPARVGELVAIKDPKDNAGLWQISVARWMDSFQKQGLRMGLEVLSLHGMMVTAESVTNREITQKLPLEGILLPTIDGAREEANLIFPSFIFQQDDELTITFGSRQQLVRLNSLDDTIGNFSYCSYEVLDKKDAPEGTLESYDDIWEFL
jgi:hypothetical protein